MDQLEAELCCFRSMLPPLAFLHPARHSTMPGTLMALCPSFLLNTFVHSVIFGGATIFGILTWWFTPAEAWLVSLTTAFRERATEPLSLCSPGRESTKLRKRPSMVRMKALTRLRVGDGARIKHVEKEAFRAALWKGIPP